ncbi:cytochrome P450 [Pleomassaria siparia CBS 279.74]|uniref:Cytochrome P450 n=1 Tax=Pleomassaria siparia CBS 279.74 TaxID=1314801 RepID=A0A6G1JRR1_9PLEO|nr:cytochrome P450 [Pleomassaria siparia CBS 279.74]
MIRLDEILPKTSLLVGISVTTYGIIFILHRLYFHPLADYPGPFLAKLSNLRAAYYAWKGDIHLDMAWCHEKYGDFVRYGPNRVLVNSSVGQKDIYKSGKNLHKSTAYMSLVHRTPNTFTLSDKKEHSWKRRILTQGFSDSNMRAFEPVILADIAKLQRCMIEKERNESVQGWSLPVNMADWSSYFSFDVMSKIIFAQNYDLIGNDEHRGFIKDIMRNNVRISVYYNYISLKSLKMDKWLFPESIRGRNAFLVYISRFLSGAGEKTEIEGSKHLFKILESASDPQTGRKLSAVELRSETATLIGAGMDTTSTAIASMFFYLSHHRDVQERAAAELRRTFASLDDIRLGSQLSSCGFLFACINESMRMSPPAGGALWREVEGEGAVIDGHFLPATSEVGTGIYAINHNRNLFPDPDDFDPDRWSCAGRADKEAFAPFSFGSRSCVGKSLSMVELSLLMAHVLWKYQFQLAEGDLKNVGSGSPYLGPGRHREHEYQLYDHINAIKDGPYVVFRHR